MSNSNFTNNSAAEGGSLWNNSTATVTDSTFFSNIVAYGGAGLWNADMVTVSDSTFANNIGDDGDGGGLWNNNIATVSGSTFSGNTATDGNGGGLASNGKVIVCNSTFTNNYAAWGGGFSSDITAALTNCTLSGNASQYFGGGISNWVYFEDVAGNLTLNSTIVAGNTSPIDNDISGPVQSTSAFNLIGDGSGISNLTDLEQPALSNLIGTTADPLNPLLGPLAKATGRSRSTRD